MKKGIIWGIVAVIIFIAILPSSSELETPSPVEDKKVETFAPVKVNDTLLIYKNNFMNECNSDGTMYAYCNCTFEYLDKELTNEQFLEIDRRITIDSDYVPNVMMDAVNYCLYLID